jgi:hypothetical protein
MDNTVDLPGYKYYVDAETGERPPVFVAFLDLADEKAEKVNGIVFPVDDMRLAELDARERNYRRAEVVVDPAAGGPTYAYFGTAAARERFATGPTVIARAYIDVLRASFEQLGPRELIAYQDSTDPPSLPIRELERIDLPA